MGYLRIANKRTTSAYRFTVDTKDDIDLINLKALIKGDNRYTPFRHSTKRRVCLVGRGGNRGRGWTTPHSIATSFDVYVQNV